MSNNIIKVFPFFPILTLISITLIFITLKLTKYIDWLWWLVLFPMWIPLCNALVIFFIFAKLVINRGNK